MSVKGTAPLIALDDEGHMIGRGGFAGFVPELAKPLVLLNQTWEEMPRGGTVPSKSALDPAKLVSMLPHVFLCERAPDGARDSIFFRVHGTKVAEILQFDLTGKRLFDVLPEVRAVKVARAIELCMDEAMPVRQRLYSAFPNREDVLVERLILPLEDEEGLVRFAVGGLYRCELGAAPILERAG